MKFTHTGIGGVLLIHLDPRIDERGHLVRTWDKKDFSDHGIDHEIVEGYTAHSVKLGTMRGLHYRLEPHADAQLVRCLRGSMFEVVVDLRRDSKTYQQWLGFTQKASHFTMLYVPPMVAHGYLTLEDNTEVINLYSKPYSPPHERGIRYNDPAFGIKWPIDATSVSEKDMAWPNYQDVHGS